MLTSELYHDFFDYPLTKEEKIKWFTPIKNNSKIILKNRKALLEKRKLRKKISEKKRLIAQRAAEILKFIPTIKLVAVTGSLAMQNSSEDSDIDLMVITQLVVCGQPGFWSIYHLSFII